MKGHTTLALLSFLLFDVLKDVYLSKKSHKDMSSIPPPSIDFIVSRCLEADVVLILVYFLNLFCIGKTYKEKLNAKGKKNKSAGDSEKVADERKPHLL